MTFNKSLRQSGFLSVDNRHSGGKFLEADTKTCAHCHTVVIMNPDRIRARNHCRKCDAYICDNPACNFECVPMKKLIDDAMDAGAKNLSYTPPPRFLV